jgi:hypothetical protein
MSLLALGVAACDSVATCLALPCALPVAITVSVTSSVSAAGIDGAFVQAPGYGTPLPCNQSPGTTCRIVGTSGDYELDIGAPGFQTVHRTVHVSGTTPRCGCPIVNSQDLAITLTPQQGQIASAASPGESREQS